MYSQTLNANRVFFISAKTAILQNIRHEGNSPLYSEQQKKPIGFSPKGFLRLILNWFFGNCILDSIDRNFNPINVDFDFVRLTDIRDGQFIELVQ